ncbi:MAG: radical SAM protein [Planctomycetota bacterium]|jgi:radical SAM protein with 4Fe4S-binding SPASM domain
MRWPRWTRRRREGAPPAAAQVAAQAHATCSAPPGLPDLSWVDEWIARVRPYVFVRTEDDVLIKRPNQAQRLNPQGARIMAALLDGETIGGLLDRVGRAPERVRDVHLFLFEVKRFLEGRLEEGNRSPAVEVAPFELPFSKLPILSEVAVTYRCNLSCSFCYAGCNCTTNPVDSEREMTRAEIEGVLERLLHEARVPSVSFTGGEATLRPDLPDLVAHAHGLGMRVNLITNGQRVTAALAGELAAAGLDSAQVSLEGVSADVHERVTRGPGSFVRTLAAVGHLAEAGVHVHTNTTINRDNLHECTAMPGFVRDELGRDRFSMNLLVPTGSGALNDRLVVRYTEVGPHLQAIAAASRERGVEFMWYSPTPMCLFNPIVHGLGNKGCSACDGLISVGANGDVIPCASYDESVGNMLEQDVAAIWSSKRARAFRDKALAHPSCHACEHFDLCNGACPLYWRHLGFDELVEARGFAPVDPAHFDEEPAP